MGKRMESEEQHSGKSSDELQIRYDSTTHRVILNREPITEDEVILVYNVFMDACARRKCETAIDAVFDEED